MNHKSLILIITLTALLLAGGAFWFQSKRQGMYQSVEMPVASQPKPTDALTTGTNIEYSQHIEVIPGNTGEVWYNIPELGVRMKLNKQFAEELIYSNEMIDDFGKPQTGIYFSTKAITEVAPECTPRSGGAFGFVFKTKGDLRKDAKTSEYLAARIDDYTQIGDYYYGWVGPQATCWFPSHKDEAEKELSKTYGGNSGAKNLYEGSRTIQLISSE